MFASLQDQLQRSLTTRDRSVSSIVRTAVKLLALLVGFVLLTPVTLFAPPEVGLDPSWAIGVNLAVQQHLTFGRDIVFTYGPLGFLITRLPVAASAWQYLLRDGALMVLAAFVLVATFRQFGSLGPALLTLLAIIAASNPVAHQATVYLPTFLFLAFMVTLFVYLQSHRIWPLALAGALALLLFFLKANTGLPALALMLAFLLALLLFPSPRTRRLVAAFSGLLLLSLVVLSLLLRTDLPGYLAGAWHLSSSYNDAMFLPLDGTNNVGLAHLAMASTLFIALGILGVVHRRDLLSGKEPLLRYLLAILVLFLIFKHGFVRADGDRVGSFFGLAALAIALWAAFERQSLRRHLYGVLILALIFSFTFSADLFQPRYVLRRFREFHRYLTVKIAEQPEEVTLSGLEPHRLPRDVLDTIGDATVDVVPWDISYVLANNLAYDPRPVIQSYTAYDDYLDTLNQQKYLSDTGPGFILFAPGDIDGRHPFFTEAKTRAAMMLNYEVARQVGDMLLLQRRDEPLAFFETVTEPRRARLGDTITLEEAEGLQLMTAQIRYNTLGHLLRAIFQPPLLTVTIQFADGEERTFRAIQSIVNGEVLVNPFVDSLDAAQQFFTPGGRTTRPVTAIRFDAPAGIGFRKDFVYQLREVVPEP